MDYDENKAKEIIQKYNVSKTTCRVWKNRGKIPSKYLNERYKPRESFSKNAGEYKRLREVLFLREIRLKKLATNIIPYQAIIDFKYEKQTVSKVQYNELRSQIIMFRGKIRNFLGKESNRANRKQLIEFFWNEPRIKNKTVFRNAGVNPDSWAWRKRTNSKKLAHFLESDEYYQMIHYLQFLQAKLAI